MANGQQADLSRFFWVNIPLAAARGAGPSDGGTGDVPDVTVSPTAPSKQPTTGILLMLKAPTTAVPATAGAGGFTITAWVRDPGTLRWAALAAVSIAYDQLFVTFDFDAVELFFQIGNIAINGAIDIGIAEQ